MKRSLLIIATSLLVSSAAYAQTVLEGVIKDADGQTLVGATVIVKGTNVFAVADNEGKFKMETGEKLPLTLVTRFVGYNAKEVLVDKQPTAPLEVTLSIDNMLGEVIITSRRREEMAQAVPIPVTVIGGLRAEEAGAFNVNRLKELVPSVQLYSSNPRNTTLNIRGLGSTFGLTNDGIDPGVGFYVDGVYFVRPAVTALDFIDIDQIEILRGPQGTLFGKNTTAGAFNLTSRAPSFTPEGLAEISYGNFGFIQAKAALSGPLGKKFAGRISLAGTQRDGTIENIRKDEFLNDINNIGVRGQLLYRPTDNIKITFIGDATQQRPNGFAQVVAGVVETERSEFRQFNSIISDLNYQLPTTNAFDRIVDHDTPWRSNNDLGGVSLNADFKIGTGTLTSTTAWRYWRWGPSNDRDFTGLQALALSQAPSFHENWSQEIRWAGDLVSEKLSAVIGLFYFNQKLDPDDAHTEEAGRDQWRFSSNGNALWETPGLLDGYGIKSYPKFRSTSAAVFAQFDWKITQRLSFLPGIRVNYDQKEVDFKREIYGGLQTTDPALIALQRQVYSNQAFQADIDDTNVSGQLSLTYQVSENVRTYATYAKNFKPVGLNLGGIPNIDGQPALELAVVKPEDVRHIEFGVKTSPTPSSTVNVTFFNSDIFDFQTQVQTPDLAVNRGYLANAEQVRVLGVELDATLRINKHLGFTGSVAYTDGEYVKFTNAPVPLEGTGGETFKDISGGRLPGLSQWAGSLSTEVSNGGKFFKQDGQYYLALDVFARSEFSSSPSPSEFLNIEGYGLVNGRLGFRAWDGLSAFVWARNLFNTDYYEQLLPGAGNSGQYAAVIGDPRTYGVTLRQTF